MAEIMNGNLMNPVVFDCFHGDVVDDWSAVAGAGIQAVILKATQWSEDPAFASRVRSVRAAGMLVGAYHFNTSQPVAQQVEVFLNAVGDDDDILYVLDFEEFKNDFMHFDQMKEWLTKIEAKTGQRPVIYSGNLLKENLARTGPDDFVSSHKLWLCEYGPVAKLPPGFDDYWLWQYTGDGVGPRPHNLPGVRTHGIDLSVYQGSNLAGDWIQRPEAGV